MAEMREAPATARPCSASLKNLPGAAEVHWLSESSNRLNWSAPCSGGTQLKALSIHHAAYMVVSMIHLENNQ